MGINPTINIKFSSFFPFVADGTLRIAGGTVRMDCDPLLTNKSVKFLFSIFQRLMRYGFEMLINVYISHK